MTILTRNFAIGALAGAALSSKDHSEDFASLQSSVDDGFSDVESSIWSLESEIMDVGEGINELAEANKAGFDKLAAGLDQLSAINVHQLMEQKLSNLLLGNITELLRIPDFQKERIYHYEQGSLIRSNCN